MALELTQAEQMIMKCIWAEDESLSIDYSFVLEMMRSFKALRSLFYDLLF